MEEALLDELYAGPLDEFVRTRDALARSLRKEGRRDEAAEVGALRKPSLPVWAANQLARRNRPAVERLLEAGGAMRAAMEHGERDAFAAAQRDHAEALRQLRGASERLLGDTTEATLDRVVATFRGASVEEELRARLAAGRLEEEPGAGGFDALAGMSIAPARPPRPEKKPPNRMRRQRVTQAEQALREAKARRRELDAAVRKAERAAEKARREADEAAAAVERAKQDLAEAKASA